MYTDDSGNATFSSNVNDVWDIRADVMMRIRHVATLVFMATIPVTSVSTPLASLIYDLCDDE